MKIKIIYVFPHPVDFMTQVGTSVLVQTEVENLLTELQITSDRVEELAECKAEEIIVFDEHWELLQKQYKGV